MKNKLAFLFAVTGLMAFNSACSKRGPGAGLPVVTPVVSAAMPAGLKTSTLLNVVQDVADTYRTQGNFRPFSLNVTEFKSRFFSATGPTQVLATVLPSLDSRITDVNTQTANSNSACISQTPVSYDISVFGQTVTMYAQCYYKIGASYTGDPGFVQFGVKDKVIYIYAANGAEWAASVVTPIEGSTTDYTILAYLGLGYSNEFGCSSTWDGCSYGGMILEANSSTKAFELSVAGMGFGYCGAQLKSDGTNIYAEGSVDMGTTCVDSDSICLSATDATTTGTCSTELSTFALPSLGRKTVASTASLVVGSWAVSKYPASAPTGNLTLNGTATDDIHFGPSVPTTGAGDVATSK